MVLWASVTPAAEGAVAAVALRTEEVVVEDPERGWSSPKNGASLTDRPVEDV
jgi:hypothetical protein